jgi:Holliday junction resolvasome RuvABC endonuclease subunit
MTAHVLGLDLGLAHAGAAQLHADGQLRTQRWNSDALPADATPADVADRIRAVERWAWNRAGASTELVIVEELPRGTTMGQHDERAAVLWSVVGRFARAGILVALVNPTTLKQRITGNGRADKDRVRRAVAALYPHQGLLRASYDEADAAGLATLGVCRLAAVHGEPWHGPWLSAQSLNLEAGFRWPRELHTTPTERPPVPLPMFEVPHR